MKKNMFTELAIKLSRSEGFIAEEVEEALISAYERGKSYQLTQQYKGERKGKKAFLDQFRDIPGVTIKEY